MTSVDPAFKTVSKSSPCFLIWRIENFAPVAIPKDQYGTFYEGDSYLVLCMKETKGSLDARVHFWLGESTTQDESGACAIKAVELDDYLGGFPVQYREVQCKESKAFLSYFKTKGGIKYLTGGVKSGFNHVDNTIKPRLLHVKGKSTPRIREIPMEWGKMNEGDCYIIDVGEALFIWNGKMCSRTERIKGMEYARKLRDDRGKGNLIVLDQGEEDKSTMGAEEYELLDEYLPISGKGKVQPASVGGADDAYERKSAANLKLWKVKEEGSSLKIEEISAKPLIKSMLDTDDCFIVDNGDAGLWVWCGRKASPREKKEAMTNALAFIKQRNYADHVQVTKIHEKAEPSEFRSLFKVWEKEKLPGQTNYKHNKIARTVQTKFDAATLHDDPAVARATGMVDDGTGTMVIHRIERKGNTYDMVELEKKYHGTLYGGDSYVILYTYLVNNKQNFIIYFWLGKKSTLDERGVAAKKAVELDDSLNGAAKQVRVVHGSEPNHFMAMFGGKLIIFEGGKAGWGQSQDEGPGDTYLLHVRGTNQYNTKAEQVPLRAESLNSNDVFCLFSKSGVFVWAGKGCTGDEREMAKTIAAISPRGYNLLCEGQEKDDFWSLLGGKGAYSTSPRLTTQGSVEECDPRLLQCSNASGAFQVNEICDFTQENDLVPDDVFILDVFDRVFVWVGDDARPEEKTMAMDAALEYIETDPAGRDPGTAVFLIKQGYEPPDFVGFFGVWDRDLWSNGKSYEQLKQEMKEKNISMEEVKKRISARKSGQKSGGDDSFSAKFSYLALTDKDNVPEGIDTSAKEKHLADEEFLQIFKMSYADFLKQAPWKQKQLKIEHKLF